MRSNRDIRVIEDLDGRTDLTPLPPSTVAETVARLAFTSVEQGDTHAGLIAGGFGLLALGLAALGDRRREGGDR